MCRTRKISYQTVKKLLYNGIISQDERGNAIFKAFDEFRNYVGGEIRVCSDKSNYRRIIGGTHTGYGVNICIGTPQKCYFFESAIDMISFFDMYFNKLHDCVLTSMGGLKKAVIIKTLKIHRLNYSKAILCVDNDESGNTFIENLKDWINVDVSKEVGKNKVIIKVKK